MSISCSKFLAKLLKISSKVAQELLQFKTIHKHNFCTIIINFEKWLFQVPIRFSEVKHVSWKVASRYSTS